MKILPTKYRYLLFFLGIVIMSISGFIQKYAKTGLEFTIACVAIGFILFMASIVLP